jgi:hypothetical protein
MHSTWLKFTSAINSVVRFLKLPVLEFLFGISETFLFSSSVVLLLDVLQLIMLFLRTETYLERNSASLLLWRVGASVDWVWILNWIIVHSQLATASKDCAITVLRTSETTVGHTKSPLSVLSSPVSSASVLTGWKLSHNSLTTVLAAVSRLKKLSSTLNMPTTTALHWQNHCSS